MAYTLPKDWVLNEQTLSAAERDKITSEQVAQLRTKLEEELAIQAQHAAEAAAKHAAMMEQSGKGRKYGQGRLSYGSRMDNDTSSGEHQVGKGRTKKKKRSAMANASNPHHLRNYIPSRLPMQPPPLTQASINALNFLSPPALRFLSAELSPKRRKQNSTLPPSATNSHLDEWICPQCEYKLFYGPDSSAKRAVKDRKTILKKRRRARERVGRPLQPAPPPPRNNPDYPDLDDRRTQGQAIIGGDVKHDRQYGGADASDTYK